ncbi:MAG: hypothetical protein FWC16_14920 [Defluviitaleaceae bacterium]|nr:hypothetical protein [Defluviitaleaceae bacterium]MCL2276208.1 hypothetical protein [Defluviitaleaceae bacterium]
MNIVGHELKKILLFPALIGFVVLALALNIAIVSTMCNSYANFIANATRTTGVHLGTAFNEAALQLESGLYTDTFRLHTSNVVDVLYGYDTRYIADFAVEWRGLSGLNERLMRWKYARFQYAVDARQQAGDSMTVYFANITYMRHQALFNYTMGALLFQGIILAALIMLLSIGYENSATTEYVVFTTKTGRKVNRHKLLAGTIAGVGVYAVLAIVTLTVYFAFNPMGGTWGSNVSSGFNLVRDGFMARPFVTWHSLNVAQYLMAFLAVSLGIVLCFSFMAYAVGLWVRNSYIGFLLIIALNGVLYLLPIYSPFHMLSFAVNQSPIWLVLMRDMWFTDGGNNIILPHFETVGVMGSLAVLVVIGMFSAAGFKRRNLL